jgi:hypothetical protein
VNQPIAKEADMTKPDIASAKADAKYARQLITDLLNEQDPNEQEQIANELQASVVAIAEALRVRGYYYGN